AIEEHEAGGEDRELRGEVDVAEKPDRDGRGQRVLDLALGPESAFDVDHPAGVLERRVHVAAGDPAADQIEEVDAREQRELRAGAQVKVHMWCPGSYGTTTSSTRVAVVRWATNEGRSASASGPLSASTVHQTSWPPCRHDAAVALCRSGLWCPRKAANAAPQSCG